MSLNLDTSSMPVLRAWRSDRFRLLVAAIAAVISVLIALSMLVALVAAEGLLQEDFVPYYTAAQRMSAGESPYFAEQLGSSIDAVCVGCYIYPPMLAQLLIPLAALPFETAKVLWFVILVVAGFLSVWIATGVGGSRASIERALWTTAATALFFPTFHSNWLGNVSTLIGLAAALVALGGVAAGAGAAFASWLKVSPFAYVPVALAADTRSRVTVLLGLVLIALPLALLAPTAWLEAPRVIFNLVDGSGDFAGNLAPGAMARNIGWSATSESLVRGLALAGGVGAMLGSIWMARRPGGLPLAALLGTVTMLLIPGTLWYHYLAVLLPVAAMAWPRAGSPARLVLVLAAAVTSIAGLHTLPLGVSFFSAALMVAVTGWVLWPRMDASAPYHRPDDDVPTA